MYKYTAYGLNIHSEILLPELIEKGSLNADLVIRFGKVNPLKEKAINEILSFRETSEAVYRFWDNYGKFKISNENEIIIEPAPGVKEIDLRQLLLGTVFANFLHLKGFLVLHASSVNIDNSAIAFLGEKNKGKSTTAFEFYNRGYPIVADDYIPIQFENNKAMVYTGFPNIRLSKANFQEDSNLKTTIDNSNFPKKYFPVDKNFIPEKLNLRRIYVIERAEKNSIELFEPQESFIELIKHNYGNLRYNKSDLNRTFLQCDNLLKTVGIRKLNISKLENFDELVDLILKDLSKKKN